jgi:nitrogen fixation/metabolism regulation signal transduction histidine kinase
MISKRIYLNIIIKVLLIVLLSSLLGYFAVVERSVRMAILCFLALSFLTFNLISYLNRTNRNIRFFFDSIRNDDSSISFPEEKVNRGLNDLYRSMNRVNKQIQQLKIENRQQEQYFQKILEHLAAGIITYNKNGFILHANSSALKLLSTEVLTHIKQIEKFDTRLFQTINNLKPFERKLVAINNAQGEVQLSLKSTSFTAQENELIILSIQDIKNELDEKELESWMKLIRVLIHEIMNSITPITSLSESLTNIYIREERPISPDEITDKTISTTLQGLNIIKKQGKGLMSFVESYRKLTRIPVPEKKIFRVSDLITRVQILFNSLEKKTRMEVSYQLNAPELEIFADDDLISQVLINLLKNAAEANENNSDAIIRLTAGKDNDNNPEICVADNGPGICPEYLDEIFVPFFTTKENGSGIGLSISRQIMSAHGGTLKVRSIPNKETLFCLNFRS